MVQFSFYTSNKYKSKHIYTEQIFVGKTRNELFVFLYVFVWIAVISNDFSQCISDGSNAKKCIVTSCTIKPIAKVISMHKTLNNSMSLLVCKH